MNNDPPKDVDQEETELGDSHSNSEDSSSEVEKIEVKNPKPKKPIEFEEFYSNLKGRGWTDYDIANLDTRRKAQLWEYSDGFPEREPTLSFERGMNNLRQLVKEAATNKRDSEKKLEKSYILLDSYEDPVLFLIDLVIQMRKFGTSRNWKSILLELLRKNQGETSFFESKVKDWTEGELPINKVLLAFFPQLELRGTTPRLQLMFSKLSNSDSSLSEMIERLKVLSEVCTEVGMTDVHQHLFLHLPTTEIKKDIVNGLESSYKNAADKLSKLDLSNKDNQATITECRNMMSPMTLLEK